LTSLKDRPLYDDISKELNSSGIFTLLLSFYRSGIDPIMKDISFIDQLDVSESLIHQKLDISENEFEQVAKVLEMCANDPLGLESI